MSLSRTQQAYLEVIKEQPSLYHDNAGAAQLVADRLGSNATAASIASVKSNMKRSGLLNDVLQSGEPSRRSAAVSDVENSNELPSGDEAEEPDEVIGERIEKAYGAFHRMIDWAIRGRVPSLIGSGPPGLGKSFGVTRAIQELDCEPEDLKDPADEPNRLVDAQYLDQMLAEDGAELPEGMSKSEYFGVRPYRVIRGSITPPGLYMALWETHDNGVLVLDDCDEVFANEEAMNLLKGALESESRRRINWQKRASWLEDEGIPRQFDYSGAVVFLTNIDFSDEIAKGNRASKHFAALIDRSMYISLGIKTKRDVMIRLRQVARQMLRDKDLDDDTIETIMEFVAEHRDKFYTLSIRLLKQIADAYLRSPETWQDDILVSKTRTRWGNK